nr:zf-CCHC domain-containing protein/UBN2 domain-containing protein [Tanacetum cinerariifolium]
KYERSKSIALKTKKESIDDETSTSRSDDKEYAMAVRNFKKFFRKKNRFVRQVREEKKSFRQRDKKKGKSYHKCFRCDDLNHLIGDCPKPSCNKDQKAFIGGSWSDSKNDAKGKTNDETCLMAQLSNKVTLNSSYYSDNASSLYNDRMQIEYNSLCEISLKIINKNKILKTKRDLLEKKVLELNEKVKKLERSKEIEIACKSCEELKLENAKLKETQVKFVKFDKSAILLREMLNNQKSPCCKIGLGFDRGKASTSGTKTMSFVGSSAEKAMDGSTIKVHGSTLPGSEKVSLFGFACSSDFKRKGESEVTKAEGNDGVAMSYVGWILWKDYLAGVKEWYQSFGYRELDEDKDPKEDEFKEEEDPQEEEDDMEIDIEEDENEPKLTYPYEEVENSIEYEDETIPANVHEVGELFDVPFLREEIDSLLFGLMRRDINSLFGRMASISRRLCGHETVHALVEKKGKSKDKFYGKLILELGNEVRSSVEKGAAAMEKLVEKLGNTDDKVECKKLKKELEEARGFVFEERPNEAINVPIEDEKSHVTMPPKPVRMTQAAIRRMIKDSVDASIATEQARQANVRNDASGFGPARGQDAAPAVRECTFSRFMKCNPSVLGTVKLRRWFEKTKSVFKISECVEGKKVKFIAATLEGPALTWWKSKVATIGLETVNQMPWTEMKQLMIAEFCPIEEVQRMEHELWNLKVKE